MSEETDDARVMRSLRDNSSGRVADIRYDHKCMTIAAINASLQRLQKAGLVRSTKRHGRRKIDTYWEATPT